jgi:hypothetical protein
MENKCVFTLSENLYKYLDDFIKKNQWAKEAKWSRFLSLKTLRVIYENTQIETLILNRTSFIQFVKRNHRTHLKSLNIGEVAVINPIPITVRTERLSLKNPFKYKVRKGRPSLNPKLIEVIQKFQDKMTQKELAKFLGVSQSTISKYLRR